MARISTTAMQTSLKNRKNTASGNVSQDAKAMGHGGIFKVDLIGMEHPLRFEDVAVRHVLRHFQKTTHRFCTYAVGYIHHKTASRHHGFSVLAIGKHKCKDS